MTGVSMLDVMVESGVLDPTDASQLFVEPGRFLWHKPGSGCAQIRSSNRVSAGFVLADNRFSLCPVCRVSGFWDADWHAADVVSVLAKNNYIIQNSPYPTIVNASVGGSRSLILQNLHILKRTDALRDMFVTEQALFDSLRMAEKTVKDIAVCLRSFNFDNLIATDKLERLLKAHDDDVLDMGVDIWVVKEPDDGMDALAATAHIPPDPFVSFGFVMRVPLLLFLAYCPQNDRAVLTVDDGCTADEVKRLAGMPVAGSRMLYALRATKV